MTREHRGLGGPIDRKGVKSGKQHAAERRAGRLTEPAACDHCGAVLKNRTWRRRRRFVATLLDEARWVTCPACTQEEREEYMGRVLVTLAPDDDLELIRARVRNVAARAARSQPLRRIVSMEQTGKTLEILTTSQKLAHRLAKELAKAFGGRPAYGWSDDGSLLARVRQ